MEIKVRVRANSRREHFEKVSEREFLISVREKAQDNAANDRVVELVALHLKRPKTSVRIVRGQRSPLKTLAIE